MTAIDETGRIYSSSFISETGDSIYSTSHNSIGRRLFNVVRVFYQTCTENAHISDTTAKSITRYMIALISIQNTATNAITRLISESITTANSCFKTLTRTLTDTISITDSVTTFKATMKLLTESITVAATMSNRTLTRTITELVNSANTLTKSLTRVLASESVTVTDSLSKIITRTIQEVVTLTSLFIRSLTRLLTENILVTDTITKYNAVIKVLTEVIDVDDDLNWLRPMVTTVKHTVASNIKKATKLVLGGEELE